MLQSDGFNLLIDAGSATLIKLQEHLDPLDLDAVILSHYHHDHIADLGVLQYYWQLHPKRKNGILENFMKKELDRCSKIMFPH
ncbi:hypothetical protein EfmAA242_08370 [Enterococcus faecium]|nr:hypothetical protein EfmAA242_08370 [Enterococcus faecium]